MKVRDSFHLYALASLRIRIGMKPAWRKATSQPAGVLRGLLGSMRMLPGWWWGSPLLRVVRSEDTRTKEIPDFYVSPAGLATPGHTNSLLPWWLRCSESYVTQASVWILGHEYPMTHIYVAVIFCACTRFGISLCRCLFQGLRTLMCSSWELSKCRCSNRLPMSDL